MAFTSKQITVNKEEGPSKAPLSTVSNNIPPLSKGEIELILVLIKDTNFKGEHVEKIFNLVYKLQQYYLSLNQ